MPRDLCRKGVENDTTPAGHRHLGDRGQQPAIRQIVAGGDMPGADLAADEVAIASLGGEVDRWRRTGLAALDLAEIKRAAEMTRVLADQDQRVAVLLEGAVDRRSEVCQ